MTPQTHEPGHPHTDLLLQGEDSYRLLVESVKDYAIFLLDPEGRVLTWNEGAERIKGYRADEIVGHPFSDFYADRVDGEGRLARELRLAAETGRFEEEGWRERKDGSRFWANVILTPLKDGEGRVRGFARVTHDLTARRRMEEQARQLASEQAARAEAEVGSRRRDQFLSMLAHELRNPLAPVRNALHLLRPGAGAQAAEQARAIIERQVAHMAELIDDLVDVSRLDSQLITLEPAPLELGDYVRTVAGDHRPMLEAGGLSLHLELPPETLWVMADRTRLAQVLANLLANAGQFTQAGGRVTVRLRRSVGDAPGEAVISVIDTGAGITPELLPRIWDSLAQEDTSLARTGGGLGLGLALVRGLVHLHGGRVEALSAGPGHGAEFRVALPLIEAPAPEARPPQQDVASSGRPLRVLVIEDHQDAAMSMRMLLEMAGDEVRLASSGHMGLDEARSWRPDVVFSDLGLPGLSGFEVAEALRRDLPSPQPYLVAISGYSSREVRQKAMAAGFDAHLVKPTAPEELYRILAERRGQPAPPAASL